MPLFLLSFVIATAISWVLLLIIIPIAQKVSQFSMPPWGEALWKLAVVAAASNAAAVAANPLHWFLGTVAGAVVFFVLMHKWFDVDLFDAIVITAVSWIVRQVVFMALIGAVQSALA